MSVCIGRVVINAEVLNSIVKPYILSNQSVLNAIDFHMDKGTIVFNARGRYLVQFKARGTVDIVRFNFGPEGHHLTLAVYLKLYPRYLRLFARNPLEMAFTGQPGFRFNGNTMKVDLRRIPLLAAIGNMQVAGADLFSLLEITAAGRSEEGLLFELSLAEERISFE